MNQALLHILASTPVPRDLPLPLPLPEGLLKALLVLFFLIHILFVNLTVGASILVTILEHLGLRRPRLDHLAHELTRTITVNKSLAVVMGIGPLLCINLVYTPQWYGANALTGHAWLLIIPLITLAFLLAYLHKYTWHHWHSGRAKTTHRLVGLSSSLLFLAIPFVFLANVNLMLLPDQWAKVQGFFSSLRVGNVLPRYLHFLLASIALTALASAGWFTRPSIAATLPDFSRDELRRLFYRITAWTTAAQFIAGPLLLFTLPSQGITPKLYAIILPSASIGLLTLLVLIHKLRQPPPTLHSAYPSLCILFSIVVLGMGSGRHVYREAALASHRQQIITRSQAYENALLTWNLSHPASADTDQDSPADLFASCAACHAPDHTLVGPSLREIASIYPNNPNGIVQWATAPGKKRPNMPPMPPLAHLGQEKLHRIAAYMLEQAPE